ncbi:MAG: hypothetical protein AAGA24_03115 [Pseudomonadota bacterium]
MKLSSVTQKPAVPAMPKAPQNQERPHILAGRASRWARRAA